MEELNIKLDDIDYSQQPVYEQAPVRQQKREVASTALSPNEVRVTICVTKKAKDVWIAASKKLDINQWEMADIMFRLANPDNPKIIEMAQQARDKANIIRTRKNELNAKLRSLTPEQLEKILNS